MRVAVLSDIHGFDLALDAVLADIATVTDIEEIVVAGDLCEGGPAPAAVLDWLRNGSFTVLTGNTDRDLVEAAGERRSDRGVVYALDQIGDEGVGYLAELVFSRRISPPGGRSTADDLLVFHANPHNLDDKLHPEMSDRELRETIGATTAAVVAFGHVHIAYTRRLDGLLLADVSAVGNPKDRDLRCKWGLFRWDASERTWEVEIRRVPYPLEATEAEIRRSGLPNPEKTIRKLRRASY